MAIKGKTFSTTPPPLPAPTGAPEPYDPNTLPPAGTGEPPGPAPGGGCPPGQVPKSNGKGCKPAGQWWDESPDELSTAGKETCDETQHPGRDSNGNPGPDFDCYWCNFETKKWERGWCGEGKPGGGAGGAKAGAKAGAAGFSGGIPGVGEADVIWQEILKRLSGGTRYTPEVMASLLGQTKLTAEKQAENQRQQYLENLAQRGIARAPFASAGFRDIRAGVSAQVMQSQNQILKAKIDADYQDKTEAINAGLNWLNSLRNFIASSQATQASRDVGMANVQLGYARLAQELQVVREQYAQQLNILTIVSPYL